MKPVSRETLRAEENVESPAAICSGFFRTDLDLFSVMFSESERSSVHDIISCFFLCGGLMAPSGESAPPAGHLY